VTLAELAEIVIGYGGDTALNLDGGGSTTLVVEGKSGKPVRLNSSIDNRIPGRERPVANHLGIYGAPSTQ
jgi:exopolysaccharide biosynthesis protein